MKKIDLQILVGPTLTGPGQDPLALKRQTKQ